MELITEKELTQFFDIFMKEMISQLLGKSDPQLTFFIVTVSPGGLSAIMADGNVVAPVEGDNRNQLIAQAIGGQLGSARVVVCAVVAAEVGVVDGVANGVEVITFKGNIINKQIRMSALQVERDAAGVITNLKPMWIPEGTIESNTLIAFWTAYSTHRLGVFVRKGQFN